MKLKKGFAFLYILIIAALVLGGGVFYFYTSNKGVGSDIVPSENLESVAGEVVTALKSKDMTKVSGYVKEGSKVRFSPYANVTPDDVLLSDDEIETAFEDDTVRKWGIYDGSGEEINLTLSQYYEKFIYDKDFAGNSQVSLNSLVGQGNTLVNITDVYPNSEYVEYYIPGTEEYGGVDWSSLILVFTKDSDKWYLEGIVHNQWTI